MDQPKTRAAGLLAIATGIAGFALLAIHPGGEARDFLGVLKEEAANRLIDGVVHGGFVVVLALQVAAYAVFAGKLGWRMTALTGLALFAAGAIALGGSMVLDGLAIPAIAARYLPHPDKIENARVLFAFAGILISILMPLGLAFQSAAVAVWGWALAASDKRVVGAFGVVFGLVLIAAAAMGFVTANPMALMAGIAGLAVWAAIAGATMVRG
jgi:hypothetical protein